MENLEELETMEELETAEDLKAEVDALLRNLEEAKEFFLETSRNARCKRHRMEKDGTINGYWDGRQRAREYSYKSAAEILDEIIQEARCYHVE